VRKGEHVGQGDEGWGSPGKSVTGEAVQQRRSDGVPMKAASLGDKRWSAQAPTTSGKKGEGEARGIEARGLSWRELTERGGRGGCGFDSGTVDSELRHRSGQKAMGSGGASCAARLKEKRGAEKRKRATAALDAFEAPRRHGAAGRGWYGRGG
jgi:hypothetical protein